jgi:hypothetical protein
MDGVNCGLIASSSVKAVQALSFTVCPKYGPWPKDVMTFAKSLMRVRGKCLIKSTF